MRKSEITVRRGYCKGRNEKFYWGGGGGAEGGGEGLFHAFMGI